MAGDAVQGVARLTLGEARAIIGSLSFPSKLPGTSFSLSAFHCKTGSKLAEIPGSVCADCYAKRDHYTMPNPRLAMQRRLDGITHPRWVEAMVRLLSHIHSKSRIRVDLGLKGQKLQAAGGSRWRWNETGYHRWHDAGDLQSVDHFARICGVARRTPTVKHWLPTQELGMVRAYTGAIPDNLVIRVSSVMVDDQTRRNWSHTSSVFTETPPAGAYVCPAPQNRNECGSCRACWNRDVAHISYHRH